MRKNRDPEPDDAGKAIEDYLNAASADGTRHLGCGQPWIYCYCGMPRPNSPR